MVTTMIIKGILSSHRCLIETWHTLSDIFLSLSDNILINYCIWSLFFNVITLYISKDISFGHTYRPIFDWILWLKWHPVEHIQRLSYC